MTHRVGVEPELVQAAFGRAENDSNDHAGSFTVTDARMVLFPARSLYGTFAYATSPLVLTRLARDMQAAGARTLPEVPAVDEQQVLVTSHTALVIDERVFFEDLDFGVGQADKQGIDKWAELLSTRLFPETQHAPFTEILKRRLALVPDSAFDFLCQRGTEVNAHIRILDEKKTTEGGALWYEESLPAESVLAGIVWCERSYGSSLPPDQLLGRLCHGAINCQMGGKTTTGRGCVRFLFTGEEG
jgi:CRISPR-associated protein Cmr4